MAAASTCGDELRRARKLRGLTQLELARRSGLSAPAVRAYEGGARHPSAKAVQALALALGLPGEETARLLGLAGYAIDPGRTLGERFGAYSMQELEREVASRPWPAYVSNQAYDIVVANHAFERVIGIDLSRQYTGFNERNLIAALSDTPYADRLLNWDALATFLIGLAKGDPRREESDDRPLPWLEAAFRRFLDGDARRIRRFFDLWESAPPIPHRLRQSYEIAWRAEDGATLRFICTLALAEQATELHWNEWVPGDTSTWEWLSRAR